MRISTVSFVCCPASILLSLPMQVGRRGGSEVQPWPGPRHSEGGVDGSAPPDDRGDGHNGSPHQRGAAPSLRIWETVSKGIHNREGLRPAWCPGRKRRWGKPCKCCMPGVSGAEVQGWMGQRSTEDKHVLGWMHTSSRAYWLAHPNLQKQASRMANAAFMCSTATKFRGSACPPPPVEAPRPNSWLL